jgi:hypothetical protein
MADNETYLRYAEECLRIAEKMSGKDRQTLLQIAEAWRSRARSFVPNENPANGEKPDGEASSIQ